jgi:hypothetical protein
MVSVLSTAVRRPEAPQLMDGRVAELVHLKCRSGEGA